jgi:hypothetical protein
MPHGLVSAIPGVAIFAGYGPSAELEREEGPGYKVIIVTSKPQLLPSNM